jgi:hypothetical protein
MVRTKRLTIRVTEQTLSDMSLQAKREGRTVSNWIERVVEERLRGGGGNHTEGKTLPAEVAMHTGEGSPEPALPPAATKIPVRKCADWCQVLHVHVR